MKKEIKILTLGYLAFLALLLVTGYFEGVIHTILYILAFLIPFLIVVFLSGNPKSIVNVNQLRLGVGRIATVTAVTFPTLLIISGVSYVTALLLFLMTGKSAAVDIGNNIPTALLLHALLPAALEEALFRYLPLRLLGDKAPRTAVIFSAFCFALVHHSFFSIPYAFVAGVIFMAVDILTDSVLPSFIMHFLNNAISVILTISFTAEEYTPYLFISLGALTALSFVYFAVKRKALISEIKDAFSVKESPEFSYEPILLAVPTLFMAMAELL